MSLRPELKLDWCSYKAAKFAVEHWHYSRKMPCGKMQHIGVYEGGVFRGVIIYGRGANNHIGNEYGLGQTQICELVRVALRSHVWPVSRCISIATRMLKARNTQIRLVVSYADHQQHGHHGGVYQAGGWVYVGTSQPQRGVIISGKIVHKRSAFAKYGTVRGIPKSDVLWKHKYLMPLDAEMRARIAPLSKPYPKRAVSIDNDAPATHAGEGGEIPTTALHIQE